jgi:cell division GTPase FtsZ
LRAKQATSAALEAFFGQQHAHSLDVGRARAVVCLCSGGRDLALSELETVADMISARVGKDHKSFHVGSRFDERLEGSGKVRVSILASI